MNPPEAAEAGALSALPSLTPATALARLSHEYSTRPYTLLLKETSYIHLCPLNSIPSPQDHSVVKLVMIYIGNPNQKPSSKTINPTMTTPSNANASVQAIIAHVFNDPALLAEALHAAGTYYQNTQGNFVFGDNKRLALLGDSVLQLALVDHWYPQGGTRGIL